MTMKKNVLALAVSGGLIAAPMAAVAEPEVYGIIDIGLETYSADDGVGDNSVIFNGNLANGGTDNGDDRAFALANLMTSRLGVRGSEEINDNLTASYNYEMQIDVLNDGGGGQNTRLGWAALGGDWGRVKAGAQWQALFDFGAWNTHQTDAHGYGSYYYTTGLLNDSTANGFRQSSAVSYEYGSPYGNDPFSAQVTMGMGDNTHGDDSGGENEAGLTSMQAAAQYKMDRITVNAVLHQEFNDYANGGTNDEYNNEPTLINVGGRFGVTDALTLGVNYTTVDKDNAADDTRDSIAIASFMDFGNGLTGHLGYATGSDDSDPDLDLNVYGYVKQALSDRTSIRLELETAQYDAGSDPSETVAFVGMQHNF